MDYDRVRNNEFRKDKIMAIATVTSKGQTTIPKAVREFLGIRPGDRIDFVVRSDGSVVVKPAKTHVSELKGMLYQKGRKAPSIEEINDVIRRQVARKYGRKLR